MLFVLFPFPDFSISILFIFGVFDTFHYYCILIVLPDVKMSRLSFVLLFVCGRCVLKMG